MIKINYCNRLHFVYSALVIGLLMVTQMITAQSEETKFSKNKMVSAKKQYDNYAYIDAIKTYERIAKKGYKSVDLFSRLGNAYYFNGQSEIANKWYAELFAMQEKVDAEYYFRYAQTLKTVKDFKKADAMLAMFNQKSGNDERAKLFEQERDYLKTIKNNSGRYKVENLDINGKLMDYGNTIYNNQLIFASARDLPAYAKRTIKWNNQPFTNLYAAEINADGSLEKSKLFSDKINSRYDEATPVFSKDGKTIYFTRSNSYNSKLGSDSQGRTGLKIYKSTLENNKWSKAKALPFNSDQYSVAHPALSSDDKTLYFSSDMPGTIGDSDIFKVDVNDNDTYGKPINLGKTINTEGRETFPFVSADNNFYFASDARQGLGGLDIYSSKIESDGTFTSPLNIGDPVNGPADDFSFFIDSKSKKGYFSSNREGGVGFDDIYRITELPIKKCEQSLEGIVTDEQTGIKLASTELILFDSKFNEIKKVNSDADGNYNFAVNCGETYYVRATKPDYEISEIKVSIAKVSDKTQQAIKLLKKEIPVVIGTNIAEALKIKIIYFDLDQSVVREDAALELEKVLDVLNQYPSMTIDIRSHTDSRQTSKYNVALSERRAKATIDWLIKKGVRNNRLTGKGYGESQLINKCADGVDCTDDEHQANRRSEFIILKM